MMTKDAIVKAKRYVCERCTMCAASPMVVPNGRVRAGGEVLGVCANKRACEKRVNIAAATKARKP